MKGAAQHIVILVLTAAAGMSLLQGCTMLKLPGRQAAAGTDESVRTADDFSDRSARAYVPIDNPYEGSLWSPHNSRAFLFSDNKARNINDIIMVRIMESTDASRNASTQLSRNAEMDSSITKFFGSPLDFGLDNLWGKKTGAATADARTKQPFSPELSTNSENAYNGSGATVRKDSLVTTISAKVCDVFPNGNLLIRGNREVTINEEKQLISLSGIVRPEDISPDNTIISTAIADAKISIVGKGVIADKQNPGYGHRLFDVIWPF
jgi:flagellar L-ring protein precursor FlgH